VDLIQIDAPQGNNQAGDRNDNSKSDLEGAVTSDGEFSYKINDLENVGCRRPRQDCPSDSGKFRSINLMVRSSKFKGNRILPAKMEKTRAGGGYSARGLGLGITKG